MLIYFRWCQSFHYKPHFSEVYNLAIKMHWGPRLGLYHTQLPESLPGVQAGVPGRDIRLVSPRTKDGVGGFHALA